MLNALHTSGITMQQPRACSPGLAAQALLQALLPKPFCPSLAAQALQPRLCSPGLAAQALAAKALLPKLPKLCCPGLAAQGLAAQALKPRPYCPVLAAQTLQPRPCSPGLQGCAERFAKSRGCAEMFARMARLRGNVCENGNVARKYSRKAPGCAERFARLRGNLHQNYQVARKCLRKWPGCAEMYANMAKLRGNVRENVQRKMPAVDSAKV